MELTERFRVLFSTKDGTERMAYRLLRAKALYKFRPFAEEAHIEWVRQIIEDSQLYFPTPFQLNDPWDCKVRFQPPRPHRAREFDRAIRWLMRVARENNPGKSDEVFAAEEARLRSDHRFATDLFGDATPLMHDAVNDRFRVCSFAAVCDHPLLWSHYADAHRGVCLVFSIDRTEFGYAERVSYKRKYPSVPLYSENDRQLVIATFLTKARYWRYEREYRIVTPKDLRAGPYATRLNSDGKWTFPEHHLVGVIYGCQMTDNNKSKIEAMLAKRKRPVGRVRAIRSEERYALRFERLE